jgi:para-nitrobenzyl esterase
MPSLLVRCPHSRAPRFGEGKTLTQEFEQPDSYGSANGRYFISLGQRPDRVTETGIAGKRNGGLNMGGIMLFRRWICVAALMALGLSTISCGAPSLTTKVEVTGGTVEGIEQDGIFSFKGIPFAAPPVGELRWKSPQPVIPWEGIKKVDAYAAAPMQDTAVLTQLGAKPVISEDCLYLNVWTGAKKTDEKRPVMVWIYGGGFSGGTTGFPTFDGSNLARRGVVLVSTAYRVGPIGFLAHPELSREGGGGSGTYGIQDQIAGLKWVQDNIARFGGDPSNVTIFGESAGAISVGILAASPKAGGLFHRALSESGGAVAPSRGSLKTAEEHGVAFLEGLGAEDIAAARNLSAETIQAGIGSAEASFWPVADGITIAEDPYSLLKGGGFNETPVLAGTNSHEGRLFGSRETTGTAFEKMIREGYAEGAEEILKVYPHATDAEATRAAQDIQRDTIFAWPTWAWAKLQSRGGKNKAFVYYYDHRTATSPDGADHAAEVSYVFGNLGGFGGSDGPEDRVLSDLIISYWVNFATNGDPNGPGLPEWPAFDEEQQQTMVFDKTPGARQHPDRDKLEALDAYYAKVRAEAGTGE